MTCAHAVRMAIQKLPGVHSVQVGLNRGRAQIELKSGANLRIEQIWQKVLNITLPQLRSVLLLTLILQLIATAQVFTEPLLFTSGGPNNATLTVLLLIYRYAFQNSLGGDYGLAAALSLMLAAFLAIFTLGYYRLTRSWSESS